jgi:hypothetical protein
VESSPNNMTWPAGAGQSDTSARGADQGAPILEQTRQTAGQVVNQARGQVMSQLESQKERAAGGLGAVAQALRQTGEHLRGHDQAPFGQVADRAADTLEQFTGFLNSRDARQLIGEVERFAQTQPALFLGGAFTLGLLAARFFKSTTDGSRPFTEPHFADLNSSRYVGTQPASAWATAPSVTPSSARYDAAGMTTGSVASDAVGSSTRAGMSDSVMADTDDDEEIVPALSQPSAARFSDDE